MCGVLVMNGNVIRKKNLVSVITLTYKNYDKMFETIRSVLEQDYTNIEYFISDDGSGDFPEKEVREYILNHKKNNIVDYKIIVNSQNKGTVKHYNSVLKQCRGEYIVGIGCNDIFTSTNIISEIVDAFNQSLCDVLVTGRAMYIHDKIKGIFPHVYDWDKIKKLDTKEKKYRALMMTEHCGMLIGCNLYFKRSIIEKHGYFDETYCLFEDAPMIGDFIWDDEVELRPDIISIFYEGQSGVSAPGSKNILLKEDIKRYNQYGKLKHYVELDKRTQQHIDFGVKRAEAKNNKELILACIKYSNRIVNYLYYLLCRKIAGLGDYGYIRKQNLNLQWYEEDHNCICG